MFSANSQYPLKPGRGDDYTLDVLPSPMTPHTGNMVPISEEEVQTPNTSTQFLNPTQRVQVHRQTDTVISWDEESQAGPPALRVPDGKAGCR
jgi:hypothetical protein